MAIDIRLLKAAPDAASSRRIESARQIADDRDAPVRALSRGDCLFTPLTYLSRLATVSPGDLGADERNQWTHQRKQAALEALQDDRLDDTEDLVMAPPEERPAHWEALTSEVRQMWRETFRRGAQELIDVVESDFGDNSSKPGASGWHACIASWETTDGGRLYGCAYDEDGHVDGLPLWFEAARCLYGEIAEAAGFVVPKSFDVS